MRNILVIFCAFNVIVAIEIEHGGSTNRESRKLFGGYKITPRFCKPTRKGSQEAQGPNVCMFNHECLQRNGEVVGACMDGFLFGACCQLPSGTTGDLVDSEIAAVPVDNKLKLSTPSPPSTIDITSNGVSQIAESLLHHGVLPTAEDNAMIQISGDQTFSTPGVTQNSSPETIVMYQGSNHITSGDFKLPITKYPAEDRKTTTNLEGSTPKYTTDPLVKISISSNSPLHSSTVAYSRPIFRPKPSKPSDADKYVLVPTISHTVRPNSSSKPQGEVDAIVNIIHMLNETSTKNPSYETSSYVNILKTTSKKPLSTSYVFSTTVPPRRTTTFTTTTKKQQSSTTKKKTKPSKTSNKKTTTRYPQTSSDSNYYSSTYRPAGHSTIANSPLAFITTKKPPSTSYVYSPYPTKRPATVNTHVAGPSFSVTSNPGQISSTGYPSPAPTVIVLGPVSEEETETKPILTPSTYQPSRPSTYQPSRPSTYQSSRPTPQRKPVNQVTVNNHVTQNIYSSSQRPPSFSPSVYSSERPATILITPKPSSTGSPNRPATLPVESETGGSVDDLSNFPPVRNPNLNMSAYGESELTTPPFIEDDVLNEKVETFVNKIIQGLQEPFQGLRDVVYNRNKTNSFLVSSSTTTTKKPVKKQGTTTRRPTTRTTTTRRPNRVTTRRSTTRRPASTVSTRRPATTTKRTRTTKRPSSSTESFIEQDETTPLVSTDDYRTQCGRRPLLKSGRIVGGKGATFGAYPWQVLVRESTWLGLFTKNKCGGVLISNKYVMTAAHCQPGFLASLVAVFGEFDISGELESKRSISRNVKRVIVNRQYDPATFENDLALLELESPIQFDQHIIPICLPRDNEDFTGRTATVTGWGRLKYGGGVPSVLQEVQVPIMENHVCQEMFRTAGHSKVILDSFLCAGYANGQKDSCEGDSGGPLVLQRPDGRYQLAGTVSHGIKCAAPYLPGVYMRTQYYKPWIESITGITAP